jgi:hypothetical protein
LEEGLFLAWEGVEARGDDALDCFRQRPNGVHGGALLGDEACELLRVEWIAPGSLDEGLLKVRGQHSLLEEGVDKARGLLVGERGKRKREGIRLSAPPSGPACEQLGPRRADDEERNPACPLDHVVDELEQTLVGPVQVLDGEDSRVPLGDRLEEAAPGGERVLALRTHELLLCADADQRSQMSFHPARVAFREKVADGVCELLCRRLDLVALQDAGLRLHDLSERPEADALTVGQRAAHPPRHSLPFPFECCEELGEQAALADPGHADERDHLGRALAARPVEQPAQELQLVATTDQRSLRRLRLDPSPSPERLPDRDWLPLPLDRDRLRLPVVDRRPRRPERLLSDDDPVHRGGRLEAGSGVDERLARVDRESHL